MKKIGRGWLLIFFAAAIAAVSVHPVFFPDRFDFKTILIYLLILSLYPYTGFEVRKDGKTNLSLALFSGGILTASIGQYVYSFFERRLISAGTVLMLLGAAMLFFSARLLPAERPVKKDFPKPFVEVVFLIVLFVLAFFLRIHEIGRIPLGIWFDEAQNGIETINLVNGGQFEVFIPRFTQMPAMFFWIASVFVKAFGPGIVSIRFVSIILGSFSVPAFYFLLRLIFKDFKYAAAGAFLLAVSRWHIMFSRVAFLGMQTVFVEILFFYFYLKMIETKKAVFAVISGFLAALSLYTFSGANFIPIIAVCHLLFLYIRDHKGFILNYLKNTVIACAVGIVVVSPLALYALHNFGDFSRRIKDISITQEIRTEKSFSPLVKNIGLHLMMFNFEGDYNGRHNLYKKPLVDNVTGVLLVAGLVTALANFGQYSLFIFWAFFMLLAGIMTLTIEAPQAYRIIGIIPALYILVVAGLKHITALLGAVSKNTGYLAVVGCVLLASIGIINYNQYFAVYPSEKSAFMDYSPEANGIGRFIESNKNDWAMFVSKAEHMYGFYSMEEKVILTYITYNNAQVYYMNQANRADAAAMEGKKGAVLIVRPTDTEFIKLINDEYPGVKMNTFSNPFTGDELYRCYYIEKSRISKNKDFILYTPAPSGNGAK
jgi:hypothetical protein